MPAASYWLSLGLTSRTANALHRSEIKTIEQVQDLGPVGLMRVPDLGRVSVCEIGRVLFQENWIDGRRGPSLEAKTLSQSAKIELMRLAAQHGLSAEETVKRYKSFCKALLDDSCQK